MAELIVSCPNCKAKYNVAKLESGTKFKCKSCDKFLIVPQKPELELEEQETEEVAASTKAKAKAKAGGGGKPGSKRAPARPKGRRREPEGDEEGEEERVRPTINRGPNWTLVGVTGVFFFVILIAGIVVMVKLSAKNKADEEKRLQAKKESQDLRDKYKKDLPEDGASLPPPKNKYDSSKKSGPGAGEQVGKDGMIKPLEDDKEDKGEETERSKWKDGDGKAMIERDKVRRSLFVVESGAEQKAKASLNKIKDANAADDPSAEKEAVAELEGQGKEGALAALNYMTSEVNWSSEGGKKLGTVIYEYLRGALEKLWQIGELEFNIGMFEETKECWNAITEMKMKVREKDKGCKFKS